MNFLFTVFTHRCVLFSSRRSPLHVSCCRICR